MRNNITNLTAAIRTLIVSKNIVANRIETGDVAQFVARGANVNGGDALAVLNYIDQLAAAQEVDVSFEPYVDFDKSAELMKLKPREDTDDVFDAINQLLDDGVDFYSILTNAAYCSRKASKNAVTVLSRWWHESRVVAHDDKQDALNATIGSMNVSGLNVDKSAYSMPQPSIVKQPPEALIDNIDVTSIRIGSAEWKDPNLDNSNEVKPLKMRWSDSATAPLPPVPPQPSAEAMNVAYFLSGIAPCDSVAAKQYMKEELLRWQTPVAPPSLPIHNKAARNVANYLSASACDTAEAIDTMRDALSAVGYDVAAPVQPKQPCAPLTQEAIDNEYLNEARERLAAMGYDVIKVNAPEYEKPCRMVALNGRTKMTINNVLDSLADESYDIAKQFADFLGVPYTIGKLVVHGLRSWLGDYYILEKSQVHFSLGEVIGKAAAAEASQQLASGGIISSLAVTRKTSELPTLKLDPNGVATSSILGGYVTRSDDQERINNVLTANNVHDIIDALSDTKNVRYTKAVLWLGAYAHTWKKYS